MESYTMGSPEMVEAMFRELPDKFSMVLNSGDMRALIVALATSVGFVTWSDVESMDATVQERAESLFSSIAETLGVEGI